MERVPPVAVQVTLSVPSLLDDTTPIDTDNDTTSLCRGQWSYILIEFLKYYMYIYVYLKSCTIPTIPNEQSFVCVYTIILSLTGIVNTEISRVV